MSTLRKLIVIVEDDPILRRAVQRLLNASGFDTEVFASAEALLDCSIRHEPACFLVDIQLSGMSGIDLKRRLVALGSTIPVIFMTAFDDEATRQEAIAMGCIAYLHKPFPAHSLIGAIESIG
jgi:FixJ family two-component response regulator